MPILEPKVEAMVSCGGSSRVHEAGTSRPAEGEPRAKTSPSALPSALR